MSATFRFLLNGTPVTVEGVAPSTTLLAWLREHSGLTGTKEGCAEGDCGACTVMLVERDGERLRWSPINACIRPLPSVAASAVFTVESLRGEDGTLHPVQQAMVESHGSQCGFCTPGFVMSLFGLYKNVPAATRAEVDDALSGNLCRCTGYRPILEAAQRMRELPMPADWRGRATGEAATSVAQSEAALFQALASLGSPEIDFEVGGERWITPATEDALAASYADHPDAVLVAGATDVGLWITKQHRSMPVMIGTLGASGMATIRTDDRVIDIGAAVSLADAFAALVEDWPELREAFVRFASVPIRNSGTLGGNVANGSPIGDSMPALIALGATVVLRRNQERRELPLEDFYLGYQKTARRAGEFVSRIRVPRRIPGRVLRAWKVSKRYDQDISSVFACFALHLDGSRIVDARVACGGVAPVPARARRTEGVLAGAHWDATTASLAERTLRDEFTPIDDMRASAAYRRAVLGNLVRRLYTETGSAAALTRIDDVRVAPLPQ
jgi:xanthine dehydrogenase small subunit